MYGLSAKQNHTPEKLEGEVLDTLTILRLQHVALPLELCPKIDNITPPSIFS